MLEQEVNVKTNMLAQASQCPTCSEVNHQLHSRNGDQGNLSSTNGHQNHNGKAHNRWSLLAQAVKSGQKDKIDSKTKVKRKSSKKKKRSTRKKTLRQGKRLVTAVSTNNFVPSVINGCLRLYDRDEASNGALGPEEDMISVIVPQISINDEVYQELKVLKMPVPLWLKRSTAYSDSIPPLVYIEEEFVENNGLNDYNTSTSILNGVRRQRPTNMDTSTNIFISDEDDDSVSDLSDMSSESD